MQSNDELKEINISNRTRYYFDDIIIFETFDLGNIVIDEKSYKHILVCNVSSKNLIDAKPYVLYSVKYMDLFEFMTELQIQYYLELKNLISFTTGLDISQE